MKTIQWFPGHMTKAMRMMQEHLSLVDGVVFVLDARCPAASFNPKLKKIANNKPVLYVLNKGDLADERADILLKIIREKGGAAVKINAVNASSKRDITGAIEKLVAEKRQRALEKGQTKVFRFMVAGVPNTGKSTLINLLAGSKRAETGDKAGVTRGKQWIRCDGFELLDTPGTMPPAFENQYLARHLAFVGSINDDILDIDDIALALLEECYAKYPARLYERYGVEGGTPLDMLETVCKRRGFMLRGGEYDYERGERAVIDDFRKGRLGRITLDIPDDLKGLDF
ncbi:MAG: ribosome biogenesis GTPase YlqF [Clostridia bacterium]|jgi:ribosome biogenesis GTPase A|nr:ribosome biogenesis GTPase YlqF [Clostridia bacterium]